MAGLLALGSLNVFSNKEFSLEYFKHQGEYFFKAIDVARELKYKDPKKAIQTHVKDKYKFCFDKDFLGGMNRPPKNPSENRGGSNAIYISLSGMCQFVGQSKMPGAQFFQDWVFDDVIPRILKTGEYKLNPEQKIEAILCSVDETNRASLRKLFLKGGEQCKDQDKVTNGRIGGNTFWKNYYEMKTENTKLKIEIAELKDKLRQKTLDLDCLRVLSKCLEP